MVSVVISIGANCGDRKKAVENAIVWLKTILMQVECSDIYETPCAKQNGNPYMNAVMKGFYEGDGIELDDILKQKEHELGRTSECRQRGDVPIDIDIVLMNGGVVKEWDYRQKFFKIGYSQLSSNI